MGIVNVTPDSFSDGGQWFDHDKAIARALKLTAEGAHMIDVGGESTRPGILRTSPDEEMRRILPVVEALAAQGIVVSVDTMRAEVAQEAVRRGAAIINDVSGGLADPEMLPVVAELDVSYIAMHWRGHSEGMQELTHYDDVVTDVVQELSGRVDAALDAGVRPEQLILDPGIGFSKTTGQNWELLGRIDELAALGHRVLVAVSRKRFIGQALADGDGLRPPRERDAASAALTALFAQNRVWAVRTHTVRAHLDAVVMAELLRSDREK